MMTNVLIISGSPQKVSRSSAISAYLEKILHDKGHQVDYLSVRDLPAEDLLYADFNSAAVKQALAKIEQADALIVVSPVYKASYTGILKAFFDLVPEKGLAGKVILPIANGGTLAHLLTLEHSFKPLFSVLGSQDVINGVYLVDSEFAYQQNELFFHNSETEQRLKNAVEVLVGRSKQPELRVNN
jgi:FMN reductase